MPVKLTGKSARNNSTCKANAVSVATQLRVALPVTLVTVELQKGVNAFNGHDYATALREYRPLAEQGDAVAQLHLGIMYKNGIGGVPRNPKAAV